MACSRITSFPLAKGTVEALALGQGRIAAFPRATGEITVRCVPAGDEEDMQVITQAAFYVDGQNSTGNASDSGPGTSTQPYLTGRKASTRLGPNTILPQDTEVVILSDMQADDFLSLRPTLQDANLLLRGEPTTLASGTLSNVQNLVSNSQRPWVEWSGGDWTPYLGDRARITAPVGAAPIGTYWFFESIKDGNPEQAYIKTPRYNDITVSGIQFSGSSPSLAIGDQFVIERLPKLAPTTVAPIVSKVTQSFVHFSKVGIVDVDSLLDPADSHAQSFGIGMSGGYMTVARSKIPGGYISAQSTIFDGCMFTSSFANHFGMFDVYYACCGFAGLFEPLATGYMVLTEDCAFHNGGKISLPVPGVELWVQNLSGNGVRINGWSGAAIDVGPGATINLDGRAWGASTVSNSYGLRVRANGKASYTSSRIPTLDGAHASQDKNIGGTTSLGYAAFTHPSNGARLVVNA